jgi:transcriptional regulator with XRE-family HTH domain
MKAACAMHARYIDVMPHPIKVPFSGKKLRALREQRIWRQQDVAELTGIPQDHLSRYENGHVVPSVASFNALVAALGCEAADLLDQDEAGAA